MANATVSLLLEDCRRNRKLSDDCFRLFQIYFNSNLCHSDPSYRQLFISMMDKVNMLKFWKNTFLICSYSILIFY